MSKTTLSGLCCSTSIFLTLSHFYFKSLQFEEEVKKIAEKKYRTVQIKWYRGKTINFNFGPTELGLFLLRARWKNKLTLPIQLIFTVCFSTQTARKGSIYFVAVLRAKINTCYPRAFYHSRANTILRYAAKGTFNCLILQI